MKSSCVFLISHCSTNAFLISYKLQIFLIEKKLKARFPNHEHLDEIASVPKENVEKYFRDLKLEDVTEMQLM